MEFGWPGIAYVLHSRGKEFGLRRMAPKAKQNAKAKAKAKVKVGALKKCNVQKHTEALGGGETMEAKMEKFFRETGKVDDDDEKQNLVDGFLNKLDSNQSMLLWKRFELGRRSEGPLLGTVNTTSNALSKSFVRVRGSCLVVPFDSPGAQHDFAQSTSGFGATVKKRSLLKAWLMDGGTTKGQHYKTVFSTYTVTKSNALASDWLPYQAMLTKYGRAELTALVQSGAIATMRNPKDPKFWLFKDEIIQEKVESKHSKGINAESKGQIDAKDFLSWARQDMTDLSGEDLFGWDRGALKDVQCDPNASSSTDNIPKQLKDLLGVKDPKDNANVKKQLEKDVDAMTNVPNEINQDKMTARLNKVAGMADKLLAEFRDSNKGDRKAKHDPDVKAVQLLRGKLDDFLWEGDLNSKKGSLKKVMKDLANHLKEVKGKLVDATKSGEGND